MEGSCRLGGDRARPFECGTWAVLNATQHEETGRSVKLFIESGEFRQRPFGRFARHGICLLGFSFGVIRVGFDLIRLRLLFSRSRP
jgi:hypothetical protein